MGILDAPALTRATGDARYIRPRGTRTIPFGDSIEAAAQGWYVYWSLTTKRIETIRNAGVGGDTTTQMRARIQADVLNYNPDAVIVGGGTNDIGAGTSPATTRANVAANVAAVRSISATPVLRTVPPVDVAGVAPFNTITLRRQAVMQENAWRYGYAAANGIDILDIHQAVVDPVTGGYTSGMTSDGVHPNETGHKAIADYLGALTLPAAYARPPTFPFPRAAAETANMLVNGVFVGDANVDGLADTGWFTSGSPTCTLTAAATGITGNWERVTSADATTRSIIQDVSTGYTTGDVLQIVGRVRTSGTAAALVRLSPFGSATSAIDLVANTTKALDGVFSGRITTPGDLTKYRFVVQTSGAAGWIEVAEVALRNLTVLGLA